MIKVKKSRENLGAPLEASVIIFMLRSQLETRRSCIVDNIAIGIFPLRWNQSQPETNIIKSIPK